MADTTLKAELVVDVSMGMLRGDSKVRSAVENLFDKAVGVGLVRGVRSSSRELQAEMYKIMAQSMRSGAKSSAKEFYHSFKQGSREIVNAREGIARLDRQIIKETDEASRKRLQRERTALDNEVRTRTKLLRETQNTIATETERLGDILRDAGESIKDDIGDATDNLSNEIEKITGQDFGGGFKQAGKTHAKMKEYGGKAKDWGGRLSKAGGKMGGRMGGMMAKGGKLMAGMGGAAVAMAGVAAAAVAVGAALYKVYDWSKGMNKALLENVASADLWSDASRRNRRDMNTMASTLRDTATDMAYDWRMQSEEVIGLMRAVNDAGLTFKELDTFAAGYSFREAVQETAEMVLVASKNLGIGYQEAGSYADRMMRDFGQGLEGVRESFAKIFVAAQGSGMAVKDFFTAINEASSGMALYNFRLDDTLGLLDMMTDVLGEDLAKEQLKMSGQFRNMGMQERTKTALTTGVGRTQGILRADAKAQATEFSRSFAMSIAQLGPEGLLGSSGMLDYGKVGQMNEKSFRGVVGRLRETEGNEAMVRQLENIRQLAQGTSGGALGAASGMGGLSKSGEFAMQLAQASGVLGDKGISSMQGMSRMAFEEITGQSGENFEMLQRMDRQMRYEYDKAGGKGGTGQDFFQFVASGQFADDLTRMSEEAQDPMRRLAKAQLKETTSIVQTLKNVVGIAIDNVSQGIDSLYRWWTRDEDDDMIKRLAESKDKQDIMEGRLESLLELQGDERTMSATAKGPEADRMAQSMENREEQIAILKEQIQRERDIYGELASGKDQGEAEQRANVRGATRQMGMDPMNWIRSLIDSGNVNQGIQVARAAGVLGDGIDVNAGAMTGQQWVDSGIYESDPGERLRGAHTVKYPFEDRLTQKIEAGQMSDEYLMELINQGALSVSMSESNELGKQQLEAIVAEHTEIVGKMKTDEEKQKIRDDARDKELRKIEAALGREGMARLGAVTGMSDDALASKKMGGLSNNEQDQVVTAAISQFKRMNPDWQTRGGGLTNLPMEWQAILRQYGVSSGKTNRSLNDAVWDPVNGWQEYNPSDREFAPGLFGKPGGPAEAAARASAAGVTTVNNYINGTDEMNAQFGRIMRETLLDAGVSQRPGVSKYT